MKRTLLSWSSGKDSAWSLHLLRQQNEYEIVGLLTTFNRAANRVAMHGVRRSLVEAQAKAAGVPRWDVDLPRPCSNADYECIMKETCQAAAQAGIEYVAFGDLFLSDIRAYREKQLEDSGLQPIFPVWGMATRELARSHGQIRRACQANLCRLQMPSTGICRQRIRRATALGVAARDRSVWRKWGISYLRVRGADVPARPESGARRNRVSRRFCVC